MLEGLLSIILVLVILGIIIWAIETYVPMDAGIKQLIRVIGIIIAVVLVIKYLLGVI